MKRKGNLYKNIYNIANIEKAFDEVCKNTHNKKRVFDMKQYRAIYISRIYKILKEKNYNVGEYNKFIVYEPKKREIVSQKTQDKVINHLVARYILYPAIIPCLLDINVASRKNMGTSAGLLYEKKFIEKCKIKYEKYYVLKCDISKFFSSINHDILKEKLRRRIKDNDALKIVFDIIDNNENGLSIGLMTNQVLAIFYLNDLDHFIKEKLKIKYYVRYQDDFMLFNQSKEYLKYCKTEIENFLENEKLKLNPKTRIYKNTDNFSFLGRNKKGQYIRYRNLKRKIKARKHLYNAGYINLNSYWQTINCYEALVKRNIDIS